MTLAEIGLVILEAISQIVIPWMLILSENFKSQIYTEMEEEWKKHSGRYPQVRSS